MPPAPLARTIRAPFAELTVIGTEHDTADHATDIRELRIGGILMSRFVTNPTGFSADCAREQGECTVERENIVFLDDGEEPAAIARLQERCGRVVIIPDATSRGQAFLYHTSCQRMTDVVRQIFEDALESPASLPQHYSEMTVGELHRRRLNIPYDDCKRKVDGFGF